jgi:hypothetical protein
MGRLRTKNTASLCSRQFLRIWMVRMRQPLAARAVTGGRRSGRVRAGSGPQVWREGSPEMACAGRQPHDYTLSGNEEKTGRDRAAMRGTARIRGRGALLLVAAGWMVSAPGSSHAQEKTAQQVDSQGAGRRQLPRSRTHRSAQVPPRRESTKPYCPRKRTGFGIRKTTGCSPESERRGRWIIFQR